VLVYAAVSGFETSIVRAVAMGMLVLTGRLLRREVDGMTSLAQSGLILIILNPLSLFAPGFQLSFGATFGLIYTAGVCFPLVERWPRWRRAAAQTLITTGGAQMFVAPLLAAGFQQVSLWGFFSNLIAIPTAFALLITGGIASLGVSAVPYLGWVLSQAVTGLCWFLDHIASFFAALPGSNLAVPSLPLWWIAGFTGMLLLIGEWIKALPVISEQAVKAARASAIAAALLLSAGALWWLMVPRPGLCVLALPGGEAYLWRPLSGKAVLIARQTGLSRKHNAEAVAAAVRWRGINRLDGIVWLDGAPSGNPFPDTPARPYLPGEPLPAAWDIAWLGGSTGTEGAVLRLGKSDIWLLWEVPAAAPAPPPSDLAIPAAFRPVNGGTQGGMPAPGGVPAFESRPALVVIGRDVWKGLAPEQREGLRYLRSALVFGASRTYYDSSERACALATELDVLPGMRGLRMSLFRSRTP